VSVHGRLGPARWYFTGRAGGVSVGQYASLNPAAHVGDEPAAVSENRRRIAAMVGAPLAIMGPVHGAAVAVVEEPTDEPIAGVDALVTTRPEVALMAFAADCVPVILIDETAGCVAAIHAGWPGVRDGVVFAALAALEQQGAVATSTTAILGPSICGLCYAVPQDRFDAVTAVAPRAASTARDGQVSLDLRVGLSALLKDRGVTVQTVGGCVAESSDWYSYRRDGVTGRNTAVVVLDAAP